MHRNSSSKLHLEWETHWGKNWKRDILASSAVFIRMYITWSPEIKFIKKMFKGWATAGYDSYNNRFSLLRSNNALWFSIFWFIVGPSVFYLTVTVSSVFPNDNSIPGALWSGKNAVLSAAGFCISSWHQRKYSYWLLFLCVSIPV